MTANEKYACKKKSWARDLQQKLHLVCQNNPYFVRSQFYFEAHTNAVLFHTNNIGIVINTTDEPVESNEISLF